MASSSRHAVLAGFLGWTLDAFDFFVVVFLFDTLAAQFGVPKSQIIFTTTATLALRPVGALIFGALADRYGRRIPLMANVVYFSIIELLCGFSTNFTQFLILRALFGIGMGGEWGVGASLAMEQAPRKWRGVLSGILQSGYSIENYGTSFNGTTAGPGVIIGPTSGPSTVDHSQWRSRRALSSTSRMRTHTRAFTSPAVNVGTANSMPK